jgi:DTW domain-containing protein
MLECICALVPTLHTRVRLALVVHYREARKPTNTGLLAARALANSRVDIVGDRDRPLQLPIIAPGERAALLFPADDAVPLGDVEVASPANAGRAALPEAVRSTIDTLVVPDGNWRQAGKFRARVPGLADLPCVRLPDVPATRYRLRAEPREGGLATIEAIAYAFRVLEGDDVCDALLAIFDAMVERTLRSRGYSASTR